MKSVPKFIYYFINAALLIIAGVAIINAAAPSGGYAALNEGPNSQTKGGTSNPNNYLFNVNGIIGAEKFCIDTKCLDESNIGEPSFPKGLTSISRADLPVSTLNMNTDKLIEFVEKVFFPGDPPGASLLTGVSSSREYNNSSPLSLTLNWSATKGTNSISSIELSVTGGGTISGLPITANGGNQNAANPATSIYNIANPQNNTTYTLTVTDDQGLFASSSKTISWNHKRYWGVTSCAKNSWPASFTMSYSGCNFPNNIREPATSKAKSNTSLSPNSEYIYYFYPTSFGLLGSGIGLNGCFGWIDKDNYKPVSFTNASGGETNFYLYVTSNTIGSPLSSICMQ